MQIRGSGSRPLPNSRISAVILTMIATMASFYVAGRQQHKKLAALEMELAAARHKGFVGEYSSETNGTFSKKRLLVVIGIATGFERKKHRDAVRKSWLSTGAAMKKLELEKGVVARFVIGSSANRGDSADREIDNENWKTKDFIILVRLNCIFRFISEYFP
ncbi:hypothetical protein ZIOFF_032953 [Zingiber officinale]|uniref:Hexosyltransferase n=1 Tax=Zingiber officinale TaxID=94328 RepID=A0A8J5GPH1_ZINOF|nr:hypothetical protein ZIOFF_032953 [Zingiber officinale]